MNKRCVAALILFLLFHTGCAMFNKHVTTDASEEIQQIFVGIWEGAYKNREGEVVRSWVQHRSSDGTYEITFLYPTDQGMRRLKRAGTWWIKGNLFYEKDAAMSKEPDVYEYQVITKDEIFFKSVRTDYEFTDRRLQRPKNPSFI